MDIPPSVSAHLLDILPSIPPAELADSVNYFCERDAKELL